MWNKCTYLTNDEYKNLYHGVAYEYKSRNSKFLNFKSHPKKAGSNDSFLKYIGHN